MTKHLGREALAKPILKRQTIDIPEWGGAILIRELTVRERAELGDDADALASGQRAQTVVRAMARLVRMAWIGDDGMPVMTEDDEAALLEQPLSVIEPLTNAIIALSGLGSNALEDAKKNSPVMLNGVHGSNSPLLSEVAQ